MIRETTLTCTDGETLVIDILFRVVGHLALIGFVFVRSSEEIDSVLRVLKLLDVTIVIRGGLSCSGVVQAA
jgi:hypothetical protein